MFKRIGLILAAAGALGAVAVAQTTSSTKTISNFATATYIDQFGQPQVTTSNTAITVIAQVYAINVIPNTVSATGAFGPTDATNFTGAPAATNDEQALAGATTNFGYTITNPGNGADIYNLAVSLDPTNNASPLTNTVIYLDSNGNGQVDPGENTVTSVNVPEGGSVKIVVSVDVPSSATNGTVYKLDLVGVSQNSVAALDRNNLSRVTVVNDAILDLNKAAAGPDVNNQITYTISGSNTGNQAAKSRPGIVVISGTNAGTYNGILISDPVPANTTYVQSSASSTSGAALVRTVYSTAATGNAWSFDQPASGVLRVGLLMLPRSPITDPLNTGTISSNVPQTGINVTYSLSFKVSVNAGVAAGSTVTNTATIDYRLNNGTTDRTNTASTTSTVAIARGVNLTPAAVTSYTDPVTGKSFTYTNGADSQTVASAPMNTVVTFVNTVTNNGNANDTFNITLDATSNLPAGSTVAFYQSDGVTPLSSGVNLNAGISTNIVVKVTLPAASVPVGAPFNAVIRATSVSSATTTDLTTNTITALTSGLGVTLLNNDSSTTTVPPAGTSSAAVTPSTNPGTTVNYPLVVNNTGASSDNFNLTATGVGLPSGAIVQFFADANGDGIPDSGSPIANTGPVAAGGYAQIVAVVTIPANAAPQTGSTTTRPIVFTATSTSNAATSATQVNSLTINAVNAISFVTNAFGSVTSPGTVLYTHTLTNNGNENITSLQVAPAAGSALFTYTVYLDSNGNGVIDTGEPVLNNGATLSTPIAPNAQIAVIVQVSADPGIASGGAPEQRVITATATFASNGTASASVQDTTNVVSGTLSVNKTAAVNALNTDGKVRPRSLVSNQALSEITYTITVGNNGGGSATNVVVTDAVPLYTDFKFGSASVTGCPSGAICAVEYSTDGGSTWSTTAPADTNSNGLSDAGDAARVTHLRVRVLNTGSTPVDAFPSGTTMTLVFAVSVR